MEEGAEPLLKEILSRGNLTLSNIVETIGQSKTIVITIGTPVDELNPVFSGIQNSFKYFLPYFKAGQLLILRSTLYPGTTDRLDGWLKSQDKPMLLAFCPERLVQGKGIEEILTLPQIISGTSPEAEKAATDFLKPSTWKLCPYQPWKRNSQSYSQMRTGTSPLPSRTNSI